MRWVLPDHIQDALPSDAHRLESLRRRLLDAFRLRGYQLVMPPLLEYLDSLTTGAGKDLELRTFKLVDQLSGRSMGVRADMTPQVTRIDAHLLNRRGVSRLCYCGSVLHTLPSTLTGTREPLQLGAELYGHAGIEADVEILRLLAEVLRLAEVPASRIDIGHVGLFHALAARAGLVPGREEELFDLLQAKDVPELRRMLADVSEPARSALLALPELYGGPEVLAEAAARLPQDAEIAGPLAELRQLADALGDLPVSFDLADLRGYHYHSGVVFAAYGAESPAALALGGRYDRVGQAFGRARPATGFSLDLRELAWHLPIPAAPAGAVLAPPDDDAGLASEVSALRARGEIVMVALPGHEGTWNEAGCDRQLVKRGDRWAVVPLQGE
ncbi:ATP phosphoribosyltransferase regulatory subunit [Thauera aminoaromatica]|jgi:ATP phosphoribosyltransferase regulatory subunit|uniref:ATP phosphoribosyltransferase regulatory subunit n=1 Tax=Thauera aminoaromatica TaxID=164330 RepID=C4KCM6_THASP|nr:ATP phosphoribosyltransferase regulatory subunit [Thauera aminoaromatica]MBL8461083.1 ATP phosphoribosyltransferase regulatory subunit [Thauera sp.]MDA0234209.1 ATP phosphoribosyltransferase regulatory subunit [Pseudomonadota bacterium]OPZ06321.1 MAG: ATP phosphoribosyltransferase regulatory subunit [Alphaproteobacteria bacterium ADurb.BinA305]ACR01974.1 histidyl-tRNA synthetase 2 [Thauera aminoaromatica]TXH83209.1 MAG: ATP phosphoribosyltransferase regulatory subunit [Thauera aminoaromatic